MNTDTVIGWGLIATCSLIIAVMLLSGCSAPERVTTETYWPGCPPVVAVEWPEGVTDVQVFQVEGRAIAVGAAESVY